MVTRMVYGDLGGGVHGFRVSRPGYDALTEPFGSRNISLDSRLANIGAVVAAGVAQVDGATVSFPAMNYVPCAVILPLSGGVINSSGYHLVNWEWPDRPQVLQNHTYLKAIAIVTTSTIRIVRYTNPWFTTYGSGEWYLYYVFASE